MDDLTVRRAQHSDYQAVMDINQNVADGRDYMPYMYHHFIQHAHCYVALIHSRVVGFICFYTVDGGRRAVSMAGRTHKQFHGQHLLPQMGELSIQDLFQRCPQIERISWATMNADTRTRRAQDPKYGIIPGRSWEFLIYQLPVVNTELAGKLSMLSFPNIQRLDKAGIQGLSTATKDTLFGGYQYIEGLVNRFHLSVSKQSLEWIEREGHLAVSPSTTPGGSTKYTMLSHSNMVRTVGGVALQIYLCHQKADLHTELHHILYHIQASIHTAPASGILGIMIILGGVGDREELNGLLHDYLGQPLKHGQGMSGDRLLVIPDTTSKL